MESYRTEEEQIDALKTWWQENGKSTVLIIVVTLAAVFGWRGWQDHQQSQAGDASAMFDQLLAADAAVQKNGQVTVTAETLAETIKSAYGSLSYGQFAALYKAKYAVLKGDNAAAAEELKWVIDQDPEAAVKSQAEMRLAQVYFAQTEYDQALDLIKGLESTGFGPDALELKGDILLKQGDSDAALAAYRQARETLAAQQNPSQHPMLEMKINDLSTTIQGAQS